MSQLLIYLPPPLNWQDFQRLVKDIASVRYEPSSVQEYGRLGQEQHGVDTFAVSRDGITRVGIQCKETKDLLRKKELCDEADKARSFPGGLQLFILATTASTDSKLQDVVNDLNTRSVYPFKVRIEFWNDLNHEINKFMSVTKSYYDSYREHFEHTDESQHLAALRMAFDRPAFKDDFHYELSYSAFELALMDTKRLFRTGLAVDSWSKTPFAEAAPVDLLPKGGYRTFVTTLEKKLEKVYEAYIRYKAQAGLHGHGGHRYEQEIGTHLNFLRRDLLNLLNERLGKSGLQRIDFMYE
jgi:hypothetical protein